VYMTNNKQEVMEVLRGPQRQRRWSMDEKLAMVRESFEAGKAAYHTLSVARAVA
jgi:transposase